MYGTKKKRTKINKIKSLNTENKEVVIRAGENKGMR